MWAGYGSQVQAVQRIETIKEVPVYVEVPVVVEKKVYLEREPTPHPTTCVAMRWFD